MGPSTSDTQGNTATLDTSQNRERRINWKTAGLACLGIAMAAAGELKGNSNQSNDDRYFEYCGLLDRDGQRLIGSGAMHVEVMAPIQAAFSMPTPYMSGLPTPGELGVICFWSNENHRVIPIRVNHTQDFSDQIGQKGTLTYNIDSEGNGTFHFYREMPDLQTKNIHQAPDLNTSFKNP